MGSGLAHVRLKRDSETERFRLENQPFSGACLGVRVRLRIRGRVRVRG